MLITSKSALEVKERLKIIKMIMTNGCRIELNDILMIDGWFKVEA